MLQKPHRLRCQISSLFRLLKRFSPFNGWPLFPYRSYVDITPPNDGLAREVEQSSYSLRLQRYWWAAHKIADEARTLDRVIVVADLGCERGWLKRFTDPSVPVRWIGLDGNTASPSLAASRYDEVIECNFNEPLPLSDASVDVVVSLHVFEHLPSPEFCANEVARILRPGGVFLAGSPTAPSFVAAMRTSMHQLREKMGRNRRWGHLRCFSPATWFGVCHGAGLQPEFIVGSHFMRSTGSRLESWRWWVRINQFWGGLFPSLGSEAYASSRKPAVANAPASWTSGTARRLWYRLDWAAPLVAVLSAVMWMSPATSNADSFREEIAAHQDGNDVFYWCPATGPEADSRRDGLDKITKNDSVAGAFARYEAKGRDLHIVVRSDVADEYLKSEIGQRLRFAAQWDKQGESFLVLSMESHEPPLVEHLSGT